MKSAILTRSGSVQTPNQLHIGSGSGSEISALRRSISITPRCALHVDLKMTNQSKSTATANPLRRARSDTDLIVSDRTSRIWSPPVALREEDEEDRGVLRGSPAAVTVPEVEIEFSGGGSGGGINIGVGGGGGGSDSNEDKRIENYYQQMLRLDPSNPLLLRNYGKFLHEVEDVKGAEEYYGRAILASPKDGEVLSLYGKLVWETERDEERAGDYFQRAVEASPDDCYVLGSYASFLWDAEEDDEEEEEITKSSSPPLVEAF